MSPPSSSSKEETLKQLHSIYVDPNDGLVAIGKKLGLRLFEPRKKINVLLVGNHSSGKSSFINWYVGNKIQKTGVAIETQGFTMVTSGKIRETLTGKATLHLYPYLKPLESINGVMPYLTTELTPSGSARSNLVTFIDTPGLADGELYYPYDIDKTIIWLGDKADLIFVFFDPIGQALCRRTLNIMEALADLYSERMRFFLTKADEAGDESDRQKVMMQIVQELCKRPALNQSGFEMSTIFIPNHANLKLRDKMCVNQIDDTCKEIEKTIALTIQNTFETSEKDIQQLDELAQSRLKTYQADMSLNIANGLKLVLIALACLQFPISVLVYQHNIGASFLDGEPSTLASMIIRAVLYYMHFVARMLLLIFAKGSTKAIDNLLLYSFILAIPLILLSKYFIEFKRTMTLREVRDMKHIRKQLAEYRQKREQLFANYLNSMINDIDM